MRQKVAVILDPGVGSQNVGDEIISSAVQDIVRECSHEMTRIVRFSVHQKMSKKQVAAANAADVVIAGGSNLLNFRFVPLRDVRWNKSLSGLFNLRNVWLLGVGWQSYEDKSNWLGRTLYKRALSGSALHSVRDTFTKSMLEKHGVYNVLNTACPTMWSLGREHVSRIPGKKGEAVVFTLTDYARDTHRDGALLTAMRKNYRQLYFWPQGFWDLAYLQEFSSDGIEILQPTLADFDRLLSSRPVDYVGTRLHAGIRALQKGHRALIIAVDNRAPEIARDSGIPVMSGSDADELGARIAADSEFLIELPLDNIEMWKEQLRRKLA